MDIFEETLEHHLNICVRFNSDNLFACKINNIEEPDRSPIYFCAYRDTENMSLRLAAMTASSVSESTPVSLLMELGEQALSPLRGQCGIGIEPDSQHVVAYGTTSIADYYKTTLKEEIEQLIDTAARWDQKLDCR